MINRFYKHFIGKILIAIILMCLVAWVAFTFFFPGKYLPVLPLMLAFFSFVTIITHTWQTKRAKKNMARFTQSSMIVLLLRLFCYSLFAIIYLAHDSENASVFVICLVVIYITFTSLDVTSLSTTIKKKTNNR